MAWDGRHPDGTIMNETEFLVIDKNGAIGAKNLFRVLVQNEAPVLEEENIRLLP